MIFDHKINKSLTNKMVPQGLLVFVPYMELRVKTFYQSSQGPQLIDLFGYSTKGMPSLEVYAHPRTSKILKEKFLFLTKARKMQLPPRRYVLCMDIGQVQRPVDDFSNFELPFLLLFWSLAKALPIKSWMIVFVWERFMWMVLLFLKN